ncbi:MAG: tryptophan synthase subunit alpha [Candidatus Omnitrophica bacterium]|nr:tryptophan synthase subunit alpha [Candidatus Omnitrophota bacterium]
MSMTIEETFRVLAEEKKRAYIPYLPCGFPTLAHTEKLILALQDAGAHVIELGMPFSDPLADGKIIQDATAQALRNGMNQDRLFSLLEKIKDRIKIPLVVMTYYNPVFAFGVENFLSRMKQAGVEGLLVVDLPIEESREYVRTAERYGRTPIFLATPTTTASRLEKIFALAKGYLYYISVTGITGPQSLPERDLSRRVGQLRKKAGLPVCVGFGIHTPAQVRSIARFADGVIMGSELVRFIALHWQKKDFFSRFSRYVRTFVKEVAGPYV